MSAALGAGEDAACTTVQGTSVLLPGSNYVIQQWKAKEGSLVQKGETIALAWTRDAAAAAASSTASSAAAASKTAAAVAGHKRPNRRRRVIAPAAATAPAASMATASHSSSVQKATDAMASLQQRLTGKLDSEKAPSATHTVEVSPTERKSSSASPVATSTTATAKKDPLVPILAPNTGILRIAPEATGTLVLGWVEECTHPAFLEGICVVCGKSIGERESSEEVPGLRDGDKMGKDGVTRVTVSGGITMTVSAHESRRMAQGDTERLYQQAKLSLVLDLDHTLLHATADARALQFYSKEDVRTLRLPLLEGAPTGPGAPVHPPGAPLFLQHYVKLRPHIRTFLRSVQPDYELTVYTAGTRQYAEEITIVLCRHLTGATHDLNDLERLRYQVQMAHSEYQKIQSLQQREETGDGNEEPAKKRKRVAFGPPPDEPGETIGSTTTTGGNNRSDHMTKQKLEGLTEELKAAEDLEKKAWELRQKIFGSRVVSRTDVGDLGRDVKSLKRIFPCGGTMAAVVDDREDVWANANDNSITTIKGEPPDNLLVVRPYHWKPFVGYADVNNAAGVDLSGGDQTTGEGEGPDVEKDVQLVWTSRILKGLHRRYYRQDKSHRLTVPQLLVQMRSQVLKGSRLVLSGLVPLHKKHMNTNAARPPIVRYAQSLGAEVVDQVGPGVTHVVAAKDGTDKCLAARKTPGCVLVKSSWLVECYWSMTKRDTTTHLLGQGPALDSLSAPSSDKASSEIIEGIKEERVTESRPVELDSDGSSGSTDSDDDDFAAELEDEMMNQTSSS